MEYKLYRSNAMLSIATIPVIALLIGLKAWDDTARGIGQAGEEAFRGSRLPLLNLSDPMQRRQ
ncbi:MAG: hypothetical protein WBA10_17495 [Elainellaceae cyanobacterium]